MNRRQRILFRTGAILCLVTAAAHGLGHLQGPRTPADETEAQLARLMTEHQLDILGTRLTMMQMMKGFSLGYSLFLAWLGAAGLVVAARAPGALRAVAVVNTLGAAVLLAVSLGHFPPPPIAFAGLIFLAFAGSLVGRASPTA